MRKFLWMATFVLASGAARAEVVNVEFNFTPYTGDAQTQDKVEAVPGTARVFLNGIPYVEQAVERREQMVLFDDREISPSVWINAASLGPALRKGRNLLRIEFSPSDLRAPYRARLRWAAVNSESTREERGPGSLSETNMSGAGVDDKKGPGRLVFEREFQADFATDLPWHHYPPLSALGEDDKRQLTALVVERAQAFKPDFAPLYALLRSNPEIKVDEIRKHRCYQAAYKAGVRIAAAPAEELEFTLGKPEVLIGRRGGAPLYQPVDPAAFGRIKGKVEFCAEMATAAAYPPRLAFVRNPAGQWEPAY